MAYFLTKCTELFFIKYQTLPFFLEPYVRVHDAQIIGEVYEIKTLLASLVGGTAGSTDYLNRLVPHNKMTAVHGCTKLLILRRAINVFDCCINGCSVCSIRILT